MRSRLLYRFLAILPILAVLLVPPCATASHYSWVEDTPSGFLMPDSQRDPVTFDSEGRLFLLIGDGSSNNYFDVRDPDGTWSGQTPSTITPYFVLNELVTHPISGHPVALGTEPGTDDGDPDTPLPSRLVGYEYTGSAWVRTLYVDNTNGTVSAFDFDESGNLHMLYMDLATDRLYYTRRSVMNTSSKHLVTSLAGSNYTQLEIQASTAGGGAVFASAYAAPGLVLATNSADNGENWGLLRVVDYGFTATSYGIQQFASLMDDAQRLHLFYAIDDSGFIRIRHRSLTLDGTLGDPTDLEFGAYGWHVELHNGQPHYATRQWVGHDSGYYLSVSHYSEGAWHSQRPGLLVYYSRCDGMASYGGYLFVLGQAVNTANHLWIGIDEAHLPGVFTDGFE